MREDIKKRIAQLVNREIPEGYVFHGKHASPASWDLCKLGKITKRVSIKNKTLSDYPAYSINNKAGFIPQSDQFEQASYIDLDKSEYKIVKRGQFAYNPARINVGSIGMLKDVEVAIVSSLYVCFAMKDNFSSEFFNFWFATYDFYKEVIRNIEGSVREYLFYENFSNINVILPSYPEQKMIVEILNHCDFMIELKQQLIIEELKRKKWLLHNLFDPENGVRLPGFSGEWSEATMSELFEFGSSLSFSRAELGDKGICYLHYGDIHGNSSSYIDVNACFDELPKINISESRSNMLIHGDVVFVDASEDYEGASKHVVIVNPDNIPFLSGLHTIPARSRSNTLDIDYKKYCFQAYSFRKQAAFYASGTKVLGLNKANLAKIIIAFPSIEEQKAIAKLCVLADNQIRLMELELSQWQQKKKALMQLLLTGIVRVSV